MWQVSIIVLERMAEFIELYIISINIISFLLFGIDKLKARSGYRRISEVTLLSFSALGGSLGAYLGMKIWHHKTLHLKFKYGVPMLLAFQVVLLFYFFLYDRS